MFSQFNCCMWRRPILIAGLIAIIGGQLSMVSAQALPKLTESARASTYSLGPVRIGMTIPQAAAAAGLQFVQVESGGESHCKYYQPRKQLQGVSLMVTNGVIARVDIRNPRIKTLSGIKVGDTEERVKSIYGDRIQIKTHPYDRNGHYLIYIPRDLQDRKYRIVFETNGQRVVNWRFGKVEEVNWIEGCA